MLAVGRGSRAGPLTCRLACGAGAGGRAVAAAHRPPLPSPLGQTAAPPLGPPAALGPPRLSRPPCCPRAAAHQLPAAAGWRGPAAPRLCPAPPPCHPHSLVRPSRGWAAGPPPAKPAPPAVRLTPVLAGARAGARAGGRAGCVPSPAAAAAAAGVAPGWLGTSWPLVWGRGPCWAGPMRVAGGLGGRGPGGWLQGTGAAKPRCQERPQGRGRCPCLLSWSALRSQSRLSPVATSLRLPAAGLAQTEHTPHWAPHTARPGLGLRRAH
ncbi:hypothetical protein V8C86DRAFT_2513933 [Haematococcus lacustris]